MSRVVIASIAIALVAALWALGLLMPAYVASMVRSEVEAETSEDGWVVDSISYGPLPTTICTADGHVCVAVNRCSAIRPALLCSPAPAWVVRLSTHEGGRLREAVGLVSSVGRPIEVVTGSGGGR
jgi:hypothetical protein